MERLEVGFDISGQALDLLTEGEIASSITGHIAKTLARKIALSKNAGNPASVELEDGGHRFQYAVNVLSDEELSHLNYMAGIAIPEQQVA